MENTYEEKTKRDFNCSKGINCYRAKKYNEAKQFFLKSIENNTSYITISILFLGKIYSIEGKEKEAEEQFKKYIEIDKDKNPHARLELGKLYRKQEKEKETEEQFEKYIKIDKDKTPHARLELGKLYLKQRKEKEAEEQFKKYIEIDKDKTPHARLELRKLYLKQGKEKEEKEQFNKYLQIKKENNLSEESMQERIKMLSKLRAKIYVGTVSNNDIKILNEKKDIFSLEEFYLTQMAIYEKIGQKGNALNIAKNIEKQGLETKVLLRAKEVLKNKKKFFDIGIWDQLIGWDLSKSYEYEIEELKLKAENEEENLKLKREHKKKDTPIEQKDTKNEKKKEKEIKSLKTLKIPSKTKEKIKDKKPKKEKSKKEEKIKDNLGIKTKSKIFEINKKYYVYMQYTDTQKKYIQKYDKLQSILECESNNKRAQMELMLVLINEGYKQVVEEEFPNKDYEFINNLIKQYCKNKLEAKIARKEIDDYCL